MRVPVMDRCVKPSIRIKGFMDASAPTSVDHVSLMQPSIFSFWKLFETPNPASGKRLVSGHMQQTNASLTSFDFLFADSW